MIMDTPNVYEIDAMIKFCRRFRHLWICGSGENGIYLKKYLGLCGINVDGVIEEDLSCLKKHIGTGILVAGIIDTNALTGKGLKNIFVLSEYNRKYITLKMRPRSRDCFGIEVNIVDHCNLNCRCCDHFSPIAKEFFLDLDSFENDIKRLSEFSGQNIQRISIQGGEPLLHPDITEFCKIARKYFPDAPDILIVSNGLLALNKDDAFWETLQGHRIGFLVTTYPVNVDYAAIDKKAQEYGIPYCRFVEVWNTADTNAVKLMRHDFLKLKGNVPLCDFISCYLFNDCITLRHGKIYPCPISAYANHFNLCFHQALSVSQYDSLDIYKANSFEEIAEFCTRPIPFCRHCDTRKRNMMRYSVSKKEKSEWT